jgi:hypothetical protein
MLALLDAGKEKDLRDASVYWPRGPEERLFCYLSAHQRGRALLSAPLSWMAPEERGQRAGALLSRSSSGGDTAILAGVAAAVDAMPAPSRRAWPEWLAMRARARETHPVALVAIAALLPEHARATLAEAAWRAPRIRPDEERVTGAALARASLWMDPAARAPLQLEALERWRDPPQPYQWTALVKALRDTLTPEAVEWILNHASNEYTNITLLPVLPEPARQRAANACLEHMTRGGFYWQHTWSLKELYPYALSAGARMLATIEEWPEVGMRARENEVSLAIAWALDPICAAGERARAATLRREVRGPVAECVADLALARHRVEGEARTAAALARLKEIGADRWASEAWEAALRWLAPGPHRRRALAIAESLDGDTWLKFAHTAQAHGGRDELAAQLTDARIAAITPEALLDSGIDLALWAPRLDEAQAFACWRKFWQGASQRPRSQVMLRPLDDLIALAVRAGGPACSERIAEAVLDIADWFP